jgi:pyruvate/2-oxoacid:ferredoxin oxidoreductase beta subunit
MAKPERNIISFEDILARKEKSNVLFFNYDNEAFMNTGIQESGGTPPFASTTTGQTGSSYSICILWNNEIIFSNSESCLSK